MSETKLDGASGPKEVAPGPKEAAPGPKEAAPGPKQAVEGVNPTPPADAKKPDVQEGGDGTERDGDQTRRSGRGGRKPRGGWKSGNDNYRQSGYRGNWSDNGRRGGHRYYDRQPRGGGFHRHQRREQATAEQLQQASLAQKGDKIVSFDCRIRPKGELTDWLRHHKPTVIKRSDKVGYIAVLSKRCTSLTESKFTMTTEDLELKHSDLIDDWDRLTNDPSAKITYETIMHLARKHGVLGGKWLFTVEAGREDVDSMWMFLASAMACEENPLPCLAVKITPTNDIEDPENPKRGHRRSHMISIYTEDFTNEDNVFQVEKQLRAIPIKKEITYKPDMFTALGIYRNNKYHLKPVIYHSVWHTMSSTSVIDSVFDMGWSYQGGSGDLRQQTREDRKAKAEADALTQEDLEGVIDKCIQRALNDKDIQDILPDEAPKNAEEIGTEDVEPSAATGIETKETEEADTVEVEEKPKVTEIDPKETKAKAEPRNPGQETAKEEETKTDEEETDKEVEALANDVMKTIIKEEKQDEVTVVEVVSPEMKKE